MAADERDQQADALAKLSNGEGVETDFPMSSGSINLSNPLDLPPALLDAADPVRGESRGAVPRSPSPLSPGAPPPAVRPPTAVPSGDRFADVRPPGVRPPGVRPPGVRPPGVRPPSPSAIVVPAVQSSAVPAPTLGTADQKKSRATSPARPSVPRERPAAPEKREAPPDVSGPLQALPGAPDVGQSFSVNAGDGGDLSSALAHVIDDSDAMAAPAPDLSVLARSRPRVIAKRRSYLASLHFRQTIIPILLTLGISMPALALGWLMLDPDSLLRSAGPALPIGLAVVGVVMLVLAIVNMLSVRHELSPMR